MTEKTNIAKLYWEFEEALADFVSASLGVDDDPAVVLPRRVRLAKARGAPMFTSRCRASKIRPHSPQSMGYEAAVEMNTRPELHTARFEMSAEEIMPATKSSKRNAKKKNRQQRLDNALDKGLEETFPASDVVTITEPAPTRPG